MQHCVFRLLTNLRNFSYWPSKRTCQLQLLRSELLRLRKRYQKELDFRSDVLFQATCWPPSVSPPAHNDNEKHPQASQDDQSPTPLTISSYSTPQLAELREWQQTAYALACIDTTTSFISAAMAEPEDEATRRICETMFSTILSFPEPCPNPQPAQSQPDDRERVMDRRVFYDEPPMRKLIASFDDESRRLLKGAAERERARLPIFPLSFTSS